jgi:NodT family efflux transporter outer membrane factor (OMF) lipoprotein
MTRRAAAAVVLPVALIAGCTVGPDYQRPDAGIPDDWQAGAALDAVRTGPAEDLSDWWRRFGDPLLTRIVDAALAGNLDLRAAGERVAGARAARRAAAAGYWPGIGVSAAAEEQRISRNEDPLGPLPALPPAGFARERERYEAGFDASWELDLFGRTRRATEAADARLAAAVEGRRAARAAVAAEVARQYFELRGAQKRLALARENLRLQRRTEALVRRKGEVGLASELDRLRAEAQAESTAARIPGLEARIRAAAHALGVLTGDPPGRWLAELEARRSLPELADVVPVGLRSELLRRRPDVRRAERELAAATADVGAATAALYPSFQLTAAGAFSASDPDDLLADGSFGRILGATVRWPVFQGGALRARVDGAEAEARVAALRYRQTILEALQEVETGLVRYARERATRTRLERAAAATRRAADVARRMYRTGLGDFLDVLGAERRLTETQDRLVQAETAAAIRLVILYKGLGGGWPAPEAAGAEERET